MVDDELTMDLRPVGVIRSPYENRAQCPANGWDSSTESEIRIASEYLDGLNGIESGMKIQVLWWFTRADRDVLTQAPAPDAPDCGVFAMRAPERPNPIALSLCKVVERSRDELTVVGLEAIDGSPVIDVKKAILFDGELL